MNIHLSRVKHTYNNHPMIDSTRWDKYDHRPGDITISTTNKCGTTWMQTIVANLLFQDGNLPGPVGDMSPWLEFLARPIEEVIDTLENQTHRRFIKTHLPFDGLPYFDTMKYIFITRDGRDVFMSLWNQISGYREELKTTYKKRAKEFGVEFKVNYKDHNEFWGDWISRGFFEWQDEGYPYWSHFYHLKSWWEQKHLNNILFIHYADMLADPQRLIKKVASFLNIEINDEMLPGILNRVSFDYMKANFEDILPDTNKLWRDGGDRFMHKGKNNQWQGILTEAQLLQYDKALNRTLSPEAAKWMANGGPI
ncbi:sulfotransferase domain-containing protein [Pseudemcibacter aquimaris]|uniref:sulfotransferase domain-containing protein n=1 Tax=Pseudemcibacter aquimaris TaxID=2857064 RepID=UPI0020130017|nr:sulfotransferase domain-containing protein [Pseudemcibacter aquimaris]MCC3859753.1 sulfotransferase domain-containing protein [Pseudemcibacter aquimaris]WDU60147.1 sulfotransferase domain-containing protein [Pseudemcibacter aquimaris]